MERNEPIDAVKGLCLLHMLFLHLSIIYGEIDFMGNGAGVYFHLMEFCMVPFFVFSGFFFSTRMAFKEFVRHRAKRLLVPWAFWSVVSLPFFYVYQYLMTGTIHWLEPFRMILTIGSLSSNDALWFLISLFFINVIFYLALIKLKKESHLVGFVMLCFIYACVDRYYLPCYFSSSNISLGLVYFYLGYRLKQTNKAASFLNIKGFIVALSVFVLISVFDPQWMQIVTLAQAEGLFTLNLLYALAGTYILWCLISWLPKIPLLSYFGRNSMIYYVWHMIPLRLIFDPIVKYYYPQVSYCQYVVIGGG